MATAATLTAAAVGLAGCSSGSSTRPPAQTATTPVSPPPTGTGGPSPPPTTSRTGSPTASPTGGSGAPADPAPGCARRALARMGPAERAGQLVMIGVPASRSTAALDAVRRYRLGGVFLSSSASSAASIRSVVTRLQRTARPAAGASLLVATDQEGGRVLKLSGTDFTRLPSALAQSRWSAARLAARSTDSARGLVAAGVNVDLAPVADTVPAGTAAGNAPIGFYSRQYGATPGAVAARIRTVVGAYRGAGVTTTLKHFPGLGRVTANTDTSVTVKDTVTTRDDPYLAPFAAGIDAGAGIVMISSATYTRIDPDRPAAFSPAIVTGMLRTAMGYQGVVISDDLGSAAAVSRVRLGARATRFVGAGGDLVLSVRTGDARPLTAAIAAAAAADAGFAARVAASDLRILTLKARTGLLGC